MWLPASQVKSEGANLRKQLPFFAAMLEDMEYPAERRSMPTTHIDIEVVPFSPNFNDPEADLVILSSDGVKFRVHSQNLTFMATAFPDVENFPHKDTGNQDDENPIELTEPSEVLELLFSLCYPQRDPDFGTIPFTILAQLAEAVEKYEVHLATKLCFMHMQSHKEQYPLEILAYVSRHGYTHLIGQLGPLTLDLSTEEAFRKLPLGTFAAWARYIAHWNDVFQWVLQQNVHTPCQYCILLVLFKERTTTLKLSQLSTFWEICSFERVTKCPSCESTFTSFLGQLRSRVSAIPSLGDLAQQ